MTQQRTGASQRDVLSGVIVFLIALPLCLGIAQASGASPFSGIIAGIIGGIVIGSLSKSHLSVSGPAAGLIGIVAPAIVAMGDGDPVKGFPVFLCSVIIAGGLQLILGIIRAGGLANYFPSNVIEGMLAGIGLTIIIKEVPNMLGLDRTALSEGEEGFHISELTGIAGKVEPAAAIISILGIIILAMWLTKPFRKLKLVPAGLLVVLLGVAINEILKVTNPVIALGNTDAISHLVKLDTDKNFLQQFPFPDFSAFARKDVWITGVVIATVASIETLLCIEATDKLDPMKRYTSGNAELRAQGIGNMLSGFIGGLPITSVIVRSSANINAGAKSKLSTIIHGVLLLVCVATIPVLLNHIPKAALAAILVFTGYRLCRPAVFRHMWKEGGVTQFVPFVATVIAVVALDLLKGVGIGLAISIFFMLRQNARIPYFFQRSTYSKGEVIKITLAQEVSFLNKASIKETLDNLPENSVVIIDAAESKYIDFDVLDLIRDFAASRAADKNIKLSLLGFKDSYNVPQTSSKLQIDGELLKYDDVPERSAGDFRELLRQLTGSDKKKS